MNLFLHRYDSCLDWLASSQVGGLEPTGKMVGLTQSCFGRDYLRGVSREELPNYYSLSRVSISALGLEAEMYYRWVIVGLLTFFVGRAVILSPHYKFMTRHTLESLIQTQAKMWPVISPIVKLNPSKTGRVLGDIVPDKLPLFAEALSPEEWISWNRIPLANGIPERDAVRRAFIHQLGPRWTGIASLPFYMQALLVAFILRGIQRREESDSFLGRLAERWSPEKGFSPTADLVEEVKKIIDDPNCGGKVVPILNQYAWRSTAMIGLLHWARNNGGVLAPAQFLWVRAVDRVLWYSLNNLGRRAYHSEGAGAIAHFMAESSAKKPLPIPRVDTAVVTLNTYLHDPDKRTVPIPPREEVTHA